jgi:dephospho-CoA kinase
VDGKLVVGVTGGIGSGKTAAVRLFEGLGASVVDTDAIAHALTGPGGTAMPAIRERFGAGYIQANGSLDREAMRALVFSDPAAKHDLEAILHPMIGEGSKAEVAQAAGPYVLLVVPLLVERGRYQGKVDRVLVIDCDEAQQVERVKRRSGLTEPQIRAIMATQASRAQRLEAADDVIDNDGTEAQLADQVRALHARYLSLAGDGR